MHGPAKSKWRAEILPFTGYIYLFFLRRQELYSLEKAPCSRPVLRNVNMEKIDRVRTSDAPQDMAQALSVPLCLSGIQLVSRQRIRSLPAESRSMRP